MKLTKRTLRKLIKEEFKTAKLAEDNGELGAVSDDADATERPSGELARGTQTTSARQVALKQRALDVGATAEQVSAVENSLLEQIAEFFGGIAALPGVDLATYRTHIESKLKAIGRAITGAEKR